MAKSKKVSLLLLIVLFCVSVHLHHFGADAYPRLSRNSGDKNEPKSNPFGSTIQLSKFASRYQQHFQDEPQGDDHQQQLSSQSPQVPPPPPPQCPESMFTCNSTTNNVEKNNDLFQRSSKRQQKSVAPFLCIDQSRLCDGQADCPGGEDEGELNCPTQFVTEEEVSFTTTESSPETVIEEGCYLCKASAADGSPTNHLPSCISMSLLCNGQADCPLADDEHLSLCSGSSNQQHSPARPPHHPQSIASGTSSFSTNQFSPTNITIVNSGVPSRSHNDEPLFGDHQQQQPAEMSSPQTKDLPGSGSVSADLGSSKAGVHNGVGFMFRVDNLVIYNSQVKMFNQNSENIAPADEEARQNATGAGRYQQQQQTNPLNDVN